MQKPSLPPGFEALSQLGFESAILQVKQERQQSCGKKRRDLVAVVSVVKHPLTQLPQTVATINLQNGSSYDLTEDAFGKRNYETSIASYCADHELYCVHPVRPGQRITLVGSQGSIAQLQ